MKKLSLILALIMALSLTSCGDDSKKDKDDKKTVSVSDIFAKKNKPKDKDKDKYDDDDDFDDDKDDKDDDDKKNEKSQTVESSNNKPVKSHSMTEAESNLKAATQKSESNGKYKLIKEATLPNPTFEVLDAGRLVLTSYKVVIPNHDEESKYILFEGTYTNLDEYDTNLNVFLSYSDFYQNGINLSGRNFEEVDVFTTVLTNATIDVAFSYMLRDDTTPVEIRWGQSPTNRQSYIINI